MKTLRFFILVALLLPACIKAQVQCFSTASVVQGCPPLVVNFTDLSTGGPTFYRWEVEANTTLYQINPTYTFANPGTYLVKHVVGNFSSVDSCYIQITVGEKPSADFSSNSTFALCPPFAAQFYNTGDSMFNYQWNFGDGVVSAAYEPLHVYFPGKYDVTLTVTDTSGACSDTISKPDYVTVKGPYGYFSLTPDTGSIPLTVTITASIFSAAHYVFDMGDGVAFFDSIPAQHTYTVCDTYIPVVTLTDTIGCVVSYIIDTIRPQRPYGYFSLTPDTGLFPLTVTLSSSYFNATNITWYMGGGTNYYENIPQTHTYTACGRYYPEVVLQDSLGCRTTYRVDTVVCIDLLSIETTEQTTFKIYPNPANATLVVDLNDGQQESQLTITNLLGEVILKRTLNEAVSSIDVSELDSGLYIITVASEGTELRRQTFVKQ